jgi:ribosomal RNA assembly protein
MQYVRIPQERVNVLIGEGGQTKKDIEARTRCKISIAEGEVCVDGEALDEWVGKDVVHAIGRGFNPERAFSLLKEGNVLELIEIDEYAGTPKAMERLRGRIIGENGRTRRFIERASGALMSVYGKTVGLIGPYDSVAKAKEAVLMLLGGSRHASVYRFLEKKRG